MAVFVACFDRLRVLKRGVPKTLVFAFGLRLRSKMRRSKRHVLGKTLAFKKRIAIIIFCDLDASLGDRACVQVLCVQKNGRSGRLHLKPKNGVWRLRC